MKITRIAIENREHPLDIDVLAPRISWVNESDARGVCQAKYRILVAKDESFEDVVWDTGVVESMDSVQIPYAGSALESRSV